MKRKEILKNYNKVVNDIENLKKKYNQVSLGLRDLITAEIKEQHHNLQILAKTYDLVIMESFNTYTHTQIIDGNELIPVYSKTKYSLPHRISHVKGNKLVLSFTSNSDSDYIKHNDILNLIDMSKTYNHIQHLLNILYGCKTIIKTKLLKVVTDKQYGKLEEVKNKCDIILAAEFGKHASFIREEVYKNFPYTFNFNSENKKNSYILLATLKIIVNNQSPYYKCFVVWNDHLDMLDPVILMDGLNVHVESTNVLSVI